MVEFNEVKDSGVREDFASGSVRDSREGKGRYDLLSPYATRRLARHFAAGAAKYGDRNWEKGQPISRYLDSALRHINNYLEGRRDEDHIIAAAWNILAIADHEERFDPGHAVFDLPWQKQMYEEAVRKGYVEVAAEEEVEPIDPYPHMGSIERCEDPYCIKRVAAAAVAERIDHD